MILGSSRHVSNRTEADGHSVDLRAGSVPAGPLERRLGALPGARIGLPGGFFRSWVGPWEPVGASGNQWEDANYSKPCDRTESLRIVQGQEQGVRVVESQSLSVLGSQGLQRIVGASNRSPVRACKDGI